MLSVGIPKELKINETRVSLIPEDVKTIVDEGIIVYFQKDAGVNAGFKDHEYIESGAIMINTIEELYNVANLIVKVKEPQESEYPLIKEKHTIFTFFHFASNQNLLDNMINSKATCYAYETVLIKKSETNIYYPILANMSIIAGEKAFEEADLFIKTRIQYHYYHIPITIIGVGNVGISSINCAIKMGYKNINLIDVDMDKITKIKASADNN